MKKTLVVLFCLVLGLMLIGGVAIPAFAKRWVHPRNRMLISKGLLPPSILKYFPDVPKITPYEALALHNTHKAVFIAIGHDAPRLPDGWLLLDYMRFNPRRLRLYGIPVKKKLIVVY